MKSAFYFIFVILLFLLVLPLLFFIGVLVFLSSGYSVFFRQKRIGKDGKPFMLIKFRTMKVGADILQSSLKKQNEADGPVFKIHNDPRFTPIGKFLSHTGLDELPQIINILRGEMAILGPRPLPVAEAAQLKPWMQARHDIKPGIISPWILEGYHRTSFEKWMRSDVEYTKTKSFGTDCVLFLRATILMAKFVIGELVY